MAASQCALRELEHRRWLDKPTDAEPFVAHELPSPETVQSTARANRSSHDKPRTFSPIVPLRCCLGFAQRGITALKFF